MEIDLIQAGIQGLLTILEKELAAKNSLTLDNLLEKIGLPRIHYGYWM